MTLSDDERAKINQCATILKSLNDVDYCAEIWGQYFGGIARAVVEQYASRLYVLGKDEATKEDQLADIRKGFLKAFGGDQPPANQNRTNLAAEVLRIFATVQQWPPANENLAEEWGQYLGGIACEIATIRRTPSLLPY